MNAFELMKQAQAKKRKTDIEGSGNQINKHKKYELKRSRNFVDRWCEGRPWLINENDKMFCTWCRDNKVDSNFVTGTGNFKLETVKQHEATKWHMYYAAKYAKAEGEAPAVKCLKQLLQQDAEKLQHKFRTAHALAKHGKSFLDFNFICSLDKVKGLDVGSTYCNDKAARCFVASIAYTERMKIIDKIRDAKFFSFSCDGTTDFTGEDLECFYIRICSKGTIEDVFIHIGSPESSSSEDIFNYVMEMFKTNDIDIKKLVGFTADGASNMQGLKTGLAARLLVDTPHLVITHCVAHRLELAFKDAIKASSKSMYDRAMTLLLGLHYLYKKSPKMKKSLKRSFAALNQKQILPTRVGGTRWLPHVSKALYTFFKGYSAIRQQLENASHANPKAEGLVKLMQDGQLMVFLLLLKELIFHLMKLSLYLQREGLVLSDAYVRVEATKNVLAQLDKRKEVKEAELSVQTKTYDDQPLVFKGQCHPYTIISKLTQSITNAMAIRFKDNEVVDATSIVSFANWPVPKSVSIADYGDKEVELLASRFDQVLKYADVEVCECITEWTLLKTQVYKRYSKELVDQQLTWATVNHGCSALGNILSLIELVLSLPATSVRNECLFSTMKLVKGKRRGRLTNSTLDDLLLIAVQSPSINDFDPDDAILHWMKTPGTRRPTYVRSKVTSTAITVEPATEAASDPDMLSEERPEAPTESIPEDSMESQPECDDDVNTESDDDYDDYEQSEWHNNQLIERFSNEVEYEIEREFD